MNNYSFVSEDAKSFEVSHPKEGKFKIAKAGLGKTVMNQIRGLPKGFDEGGEADPSDAAQPPATPTPFDTAPAVNTSAQAPDQSPALLQNSAPGQVPLAQQVGVKIDQGGSGNDSRIQTPDYISGINDAFNQIRSGTENEMKAQAAGQGQIAGAYKNFQDQTNDLMAADAAKRNELITEQNGLFNDYKNGKIDPHRLWNNSSTAGKIGAGIGMLLSGMGSGLTGQPNLAMKVIDESINRDIESQKADLGKKETLLSMNFRKLGDLDAATARTAMQLHTAVGAEAARIGATTNNQVLKAQIPEKLGQIQLQAAQYGNQFMQMQLKRDLLSGNIPGATAADVQSRFPELADKMVTLPGTAKTDARGNPVPGTERIAFAPTKEGAAAISSLNAKANELSDLAQQAREFNQSKAGYMGTFSGSANNAEANRIKSALSVKLNDFLNTARDVTPEMKEEAATIVQNPGTIFTTKFNDSMNRLDQIVRASRDSTYQAYIPNYKGQQLKNLEGAPVARK